MSTRSTGSRGSPQFEQHRAICRHSINRGTVLNFFKTAGRDSTNVPLWSNAGTREELRMPECVRNANRHEHPAEVALVKFHNTFLPELSEGELGVG